jgi:hypothetical protein
VWAGRLIAPVTVAAGAVLLRLVSGVGFANYDTLYALAWGGQLARGSSPAYDLPVAPTPHPLVEALGVILSPLSPRTVEDVTVLLGFLALSACGWIVYRLGAHWFGRVAGGLAALIVLTRVPVVSYGVRAYVDIPYMLLVLTALLVESTRRRAGAPVLALLALAGLLRPEAWVFSGLYWLYLLIPDAGGFAAGVPPGAINGGASGGGGRSGSGDVSGGGWAHGVFVSKRSPRARTRAGTRANLFGLTLLAASAPLIWLASDLAVTGNALWSLTNTRHTAKVLDRKTGIGNVPVYVPKRIGEVLGAPVLAAAVVGVLMTLAWLRERALEGVAAAVAAVVVFAAFATAGLPINTRYAFLASAILAIFAGAGIAGWLKLREDDQARRPWMVVGALLAAAVVAFGPSQYHTVHKELRELARQEQIQNDLLALVSDGAINLSCGPVGVPNHAPVPLLALYLKTSPANVVSPERGAISRGTYVDPANAEVEEKYVLDRNDPHTPASVPGGFLPAGGNRSWRLYRLCR